MNLRLMRQQRSRINVANIDVQFLATVVGFDVVVISNFFWGAKRLLYFISGESDCGVARQLNYLIAFAASTL
jgi:hypothetical protein